MTSFPKKVNNSTAEIVCQKVSPLHLRLIVQVDSIYHMCLTKCQIQTIVENSRGWKLVFPVRTPYLCHLLLSFSFCKQESLPPHIIKEIIKYVLAAFFVSEIAFLRNELNDMKMKLDEIEQYSWLNCLKLTGIPEEKDENTGTLLLRYPMHK